MSKVIYLVSFFVHYAFLYLLHVFFDTAAVGIFTAGKQYPKLTSAVSL